MSTISSLSRENERADTGRNGRSEPVSRDQILRCKRGHFLFFFVSCSADHEQDWQPYLVDR